MKLGERLVQKGLIHRRQLDEALRAQLIYGGHLGTCLIEKGLIEERKLGEVLAEMFGAKYASNELFEKIPREVVQCLPAKLVEKYSVVPLRLRDKTLDLAMVDPKNLLAIDELSFAAGCKIEPWVAPEVRVFQAIERYYGIPKRQRYVALCSRLDDAEALGEMDLTHDIFLQDRGKQAEASGAYQVSTPQGLQHAPADREPVTKPTLVIESPFRSDAPSQQTKLASAEEATPESTAALEKISELFCSCEDRDRLVETVLDHASTAMARTILFKVRSGAAAIWKHRGLIVGERVLADVSFSIISEPVFVLMRGEACYRGELPADSEFRRFYDKLQMKTPQELLLLPLYMDDRLVGLFYGDGGPAGAIQGSTEEFARLMKKLALALHLLLLKQRIRVA